MRWQGRALKDAGRVGVYFDTAAKAGEQTVDDFVVTGRGTVIQDDAVQVVVPASVRGDRFVWNLGEQVAVKGDDCRSPCGGARLKAIEVKTRADLAAEATAGITLVSHARSLAGLGAVSRPRFHATGYRGDLSPVRSGGERRSTGRPGYRLPGSRDKRAVGLFDLVQQPSFRARGRTTSPCWG